MREPRYLAYFSLLIFVFLLAKKVSSEDQDTFADWRPCVNKKKDSLPVMLRDRQQRRGAAKKIPLSGLAYLSADRLLCEILIKKTLAKKDNLSQVGTSFFRAKAQRPACGRQAQRNGPVNTNPGLTLHPTFTYRQY